MKSLHYYKNSDLTEQISCNQECGPDKHLEQVQFNSLLRLIQAFIREKLLATIANDNQIIFLLPLTERTLYINNIRYSRLLRLSSFGKIFIHEKNGQVRQIREPLELIKIIIAEIKLESDRKKWEVLLNEVNDHLRNAILSSYKSCNLENKISQDAQKNGYRNLLQWLSKQENILDKTLFFEQWVSAGHPYHPCSKTKLGFTEEDVINYSPEFHPEVPIMIGAVNKENMHIEAMNESVNFVDWFAFNYPSAWSAWKKALEKKELNIANFIPLPIHPWQAKHIIPNVFKELIAANQLYLFDNVSVKATPTLSFRTLSPTENKNSAYIKLPVAVQATSVFRTLSPGSTENTPKASRFLHDIFLKENNFNGRLSILRELYGVHLKNIPDEQGKQLTSIFRENPNAYLGPDETCIVLAALFEKSPISGLSLFIELMQEAGIIELNAAIHYFSHYADLVIGSYLDLYLLYGIALEGHQQNTLAVFRKGKIHRFIARDFDGVDIHDGTLRASGYTFDIYPGSSNLWQDKKIPRNSLLHTVYQQHLGELVLVLANHFKCDEKLFWHEIKKITEVRFIALKNKMDPRIWQEEHDEILKESWPCKALLRMRLQKKYQSEGMFFKIVNPLLACGKLSESHELEMAN